VGDLRPGVALFEAERELAAHRRRLRLALVCAVGVAAGWFLVARLL
jgi:hypothetical protein